MSPRRLVLWLALVVVATCLTNSSSLPDFDAWQRVLSQHVTAGVREGIYTNLVLLSTLPPLAHFPLLSGALPTAAWPTFHLAHFPLLPGPLPWRTSRCCLDHFPLACLAHFPLLPGPLPTGLSGALPLSLRRAVSASSQDLLCCFHLNDPSLTLHPSLPQWALLFSGRCCSVGAAVAPQAGGKSLTVMYCSVSQYIVLYCVSLWWCRLIMKRSSWIQITLPLSNLLNMSR